MTPRLAALSIAIVSGGTAAFASDFPSGRWSFGQTCGVAIEHDAMGVGMVLTRKGIITSLSTCEFVQIWPGEEDRWAVMELCSGNDSTWTRISALERTVDDELIHTSDIEGELVFALCPGTEEDYPGVPPQPEPPAIPLTEPMMENEPEVPEQIIVEEPEVPADAAAPTEPEAPQPSATPVMPAMKADQPDSGHHEPDQPEAELPKPDRDNPPPANANSSPADSGN